jgi:hypothetical protein
MTNNSTNIVNEKLEKMEKINQLRLVYSNIIEQQIRAQKKFGSAFRLNEIDTEVQNSVLSGTRAVARLSESGVSARIKNGISRIPIVGRIVDESYRYISDEVMRSKRIDEVTETIFSTIRAKQETVAQYCVDLDEIKNQSIESHSTLVSMIDELRNKELTDLSVEESNFLIEITQQEVMLRDRIVKMDATIRAAKQLSNRISHIIPTLQDDLFNQLALNSTLRGISEMNQQLNSTIEATEAIAIENDNAVRGALIQVIDSIDTGADFKRISRRNESFIEFGKELNTLLEKQKQKQDAAIIDIRDNCWSHVQRLENQKNNSLASIMDNRDK